MISFPLLRFVIFCHPIAVSFPLQIWCLIFMKSVCQPRLLRKSDLEADTPCSSAALAPPPSHIRASLNLCPYRSTLFDCHTLLHSLGELSPSFSANLFSLSHCLLGSGDTHRSRGRYESDPFLHAKFPHALCLQG